jgi:pilus assembly protein CpaF
MTLWAALFGLGAGGAAAAAALLCFRLSARGSLGARLAVLAAAGSRALSAPLERWTALAERGMRRRVLAAENIPYLLFVAVLSLAGLWAGAVLLRNPLAGLLLAAGGVVFPEQVRRARERAWREKILEQLGAAVRVFAAEYAETPHPAKALAAAAGRLPDPIGGLLRRAAADLMSARGGGDVDRALVRLGRELAGEYGKMFVQLLRLSFEDEAVKPLFGRLAMRVTAQQDLVRKNRLEVSVDRMLALALNLAVIPAYLFVVRMVPEAKEFFLTTAAGKSVVALCLFSSVTAGLLDIAMGGVGGD